MNDLRAPLASICESVEGSLAATIMGFDGLPVDSHEAQRGDGVDISSLLVEYSSTLSQVKRSAQMFAAGDLEELCISANRLTTIIRPINSEYFVALALLPGANFGKGRYLLRINAPKLVEPLS